MNASQLRIIAQDPYKWPNFLELLGDLEKAAHCGSTKLTRHIGHFSDDAKILAKQELENLGFTVSIVNGQYFYISW